MKIQELKQLNIKMEFLDCKRNYVTIFEGRFIDLFSLDYFSSKCGKDTPTSKVGEELPLSPHFLTLFDFTNKLC